MDGYISFHIPNIDDEIPSQQLGRDVIAPLWTDLDADQGGRWTYEQTTNGSLIDEVTDMINSITPGLNFSASWVFVSTWENVPLEVASGVSFDTNGSSERVKQMDIFRPQTVLKMDN